MSSSDACTRGEFSQLIDDLETAQCRGSETGDVVQISLEEGGRLLGVAVRLYVRGAEAVGDHVDSVPSLGLTATEAVVGASALLNDQDLTPFDLWLWFQRVMREAKRSNSFSSHVVDVRTNRGISQ